MQSYLHPRYTVQRPGESDTIRQWEDLALSAKSASPAPAHPPLSPKLTLHCPMVKVCPVSSHRASRDSSPSTPHPQQVPPGQSLQLEANRLLPTASEGPSPLRSPPFTSRITAGRPATHLPTACCAQGRPSDLQLLLPPCLQHEPHEPVYSPWPFKPQTLSLPLELSKLTALPCWFHDPGLHLAANLLRSQH